MGAPNVLPLEITAPLIQRLARKGMTQPLDANECAQLCECLLFHIDSRLEQKRVPRVSGPDGKARHQPST